MIYNVTLTNGFKNKVFADDMMQAIEKVQNTGFKVTEIARLEIQGTRKAGQQEVKPSQVIA